MATKKTSDSQPPETAPTALTAPAKSYVPATMTGLQDYSYWWQYAREHATTSETDQKSFRRGRIWA